MRVCTRLDRAQVGKKPCLQRTYSANLRVRRRIRTTSRAGVPGAAERCGRALPAEIKACLPEEGVGRCGAVRRVRAPRPPALRLHLFHRSLVPRYRSDRGVGGSDDAWRFNGMSCAAFVGAGGPGLGSCSAAWARGNNGQTPYEACEVSCGNVEACVRHERIARFDHTECPRQSLGLRSVDGEREITAGTAGVSL